jgi:integrase
VNDVESGIQLKDGYPISLDVQELIQDARDYATQSKSWNTRRAYKGHWDRFVAFCEQRGARALPASPGTVAVYAAFLARQGRKVSTIEQALAAIGAAHEAAGYDATNKASAVKTVMQGIRRNLGVAPKRKQAITKDMLAALVSPLGKRTKDLRDRALILVGFAGAFRRSELVSLRVEDVEQQERGLLVRVPRSKTDQEGQGQLKAIFYAREKALCPVRALREWLEASGIDEGYIFQSLTKAGNTTGRPLDGCDVARIIHRLQKQAGLEAFDFSGHSLRAGFVTEATRNKKSDRAIARQTGHKTRKMIDVYSREEEIFDNNAGNGLL